MKIYLYTTSNFVEEDFSHVLSQTNASGENENEEIELKPKTDTEKLPSPSEMRKSCKFYEKEYNKTTC